MDFEITADGICMIKKVSRLLEQKDILDLAKENFHQDLKDGQEYYIIQVDDPDDENYCHWCLVPKAKLKEGAKGRIKE